jgi:hypothetical protein
MLWYTTFSDLPTSRKVFALMMQTSMSHFNINDILQYLESPIHRGIIVDNDTMTKKAMQSIQFHNQTMRQWPKSHDIYLYVGLMSTSYWHNYICTHLI